jgi:hypothetical protein
VRLAVEHRVTVPAIKLADDLRIDDYVNALDGDRYSDAVDLHLTAARVEFAEQSSPATTQFGSSGS